MKDERKDCPARAEVYRCNLRSGGALIPLSAGGSRVANRDDAALSRELSVEPSPP